MPRTTNILYEIREKLEKGVNEAYESEDEEIRNKIIYKEIKEKNMEYFEELPLSFKEKHPELFLPEEVNEELRKKFYSGKLSFEDVRKHPELKEILVNKDISVGFEKIKNCEIMFGRGSYMYLIFSKLSKLDVLNLAEKYGEYLDDIDTYIFTQNLTPEEIEEKIQINIEANIFSGISPFKEDVPDFFRLKYQELFLDENAPEELKKIYYDRNIIRNSYSRKYEGHMNFLLIASHPEWKEFLINRNIVRAFPHEYNELFRRFGSNTALKLGMKYPETIEIMVINNKEDVLEEWYKVAGEKFVPHHVVMLYFPKDEMENFYKNSKKWSLLTRMSSCNLNDIGKTAILKAAYAMGVFSGNDDGMNKIIKLFTDIPQELSKEEYEKVLKVFNENISNISWNEISMYEPGELEKMRKLFENTYTINRDGNYTLRINKQKDKVIVRKIREILEKAELPKILTPQKAHQIFDSFEMKYNPIFTNFFCENIEEILSNSDYVKDIATMQRQFEDIARINAGRKITLEIAHDYMKCITYTNVEVGNEEVAEQAKIAGYSQTDFEEIQKIFNEGEKREFSSIPRVNGMVNGYTYEMLRLDDPLALTIGTLTDCCQRIRGAGASCMEHSMISPDGRVFCVKDNEGRIVAQSWFWRNQYTGCFDNIEIPNKVFELYENEHPDVGRKGLTLDILEVYKKATEALMQEDEKIYNELLERGIISKEQYDGLMLKKVTIGLGYNDIATAIQEDKTVYLDNDKIRVRKTSRLPYLYTDAKVQYVVSEKRGIVKSSFANLFVHQDDIPVYDESNIPDIVLYTMQRMEELNKGKKLLYLAEGKGETRSQKIINSVALKYGFNNMETKIMATKKIAIIYSENNGKIKIGDFLFSTIKKESTESEKNLEKNT